MNAALTLLAFLWKPTTKTWRAHRRACIKLLPEKEQKNAV